MGKSSRYIPLFKHLNNRLIATYILAVEGGGIGGTGTGASRARSPGHGLWAGCWVWPAAAPGARQKKFKFIQMRSIGIIELICGLLLVAGSS